MIDHVSFRSRNFEASQAFYSAALKPLGYELLMTFPDTVGYGANRKPDFWLTPGDIGTPGHIAFVSDTREAVDAFYAAAMAAGGKDNGPPGVRADYHANYYAAFVMDLDGHNIEVVCHADPNAKRVVAKSAKKSAKKVAAKKPVKKAGKKAAPKAAKKAGKKRR